MFRTRIIVSRTFGLTLNRAAKVSLARAHVPSAVRLQSTRRRIRGQTGTPQKQGDESAASDDRAAMNRPVKVTDMQQFVVAAQDVLDKIQTSLEPMKRHNYLFVVDRQANSLKLTLTDGDYIFEVVEDFNCIQMTSPISGKFSYVLSASTGEWVDVHDGHLMEGMFVRDLIRQCNGVPAL